MTFLPAAYRQLTEPESVALVAQIRRQNIATSWGEVSTSFVHKGIGDAPFLLLHGFDSSLLEFRRLVPRLGQQRATWAVDLLGFGFTERKVGVPYSPAAILSHLYDFWRAVIQVPVVIVGASMGGATAIEFTLSHPECVEKLILIDSVGFSSGVPPLARHLPRPLARWAVGILGDPKLRQKVSVRSYVNPALATADALLCGALPVAMAGWREANVTFLKSGGYSLLGDRLPSIQADTLILWGAQDQILDLAHAARFEQGIPNSKLVWIPDSGHVPHLEQPQATAGAILEFVS